MYYIVFIVVFVEENDVRRFVQKRISRDEECTEFPNNDVLKNVGLAFKNETFDLLN